MLRGWCRFGEDVFERTDVASCSGGWLSPVKWYGVAA